MSYIVCMKFLFTFHKFLWGSQENMWSQFVNSEMWRCSLYLCSPRQWPTIALIVNTAQVLCPSLLSYTQLQILDYSSRDLPLHFQLDLSWGSVNVYAVILQHAINISADCMHNQADVPSNTKLHLMMSLRGCVGMIWKLPLDIADRAEHIEECTHHL